MFYDKFEYLCNLKGVSPSSVAEAIKLHRSAATDWKKGSAPKRGTINKLCEYFDVPFDYFEDRASDGKKFGTITFRKRLSEIVSAINTADAADAGIEVGELQRIADGTMPLTFDMACTVADIIGESLDFLAGLTDEKKPAIDGGLIQQHITLYGQLSESQQKLVDAQIRGILQDE